MYWYHLICGMRNFDENNNIFAFTVLESVYSYFQNIIFRSSSWDASECGIRLFNVTKNDAGFWRLRSYHDNEIIQGAGYIEINENLPTYDEFESNPFRSDDEFTPDNAEYCYIYRPGAEKANSNNEFPRHSRCVIPNIDLDPEANGVWNVRVGIQKKMNEIEFEINVSSYGNVQLYNNALLISINFDFTKYF